MPATALQHFTEDIARARAIVGHAEPLPHATSAGKLLRSDLLRSAWMFAVGALDAYFCDAYTDMIAATAGSKSRQPTITLPEWVYEVKFPLRAILEEYDNENWRWRMAARKMMERENVISLKAVQDLFNKFFRTGKVLPPPTRRLDVPAGRENSALWHLAVGLSRDDPTRQTHGEGGRNRPVRRAVPHDLPTAARLHP